MRIDQASVVLTGAAGGLGAQIARHLVHEGARVLLVGRAKTPLLALATAVCGGVPDRGRVYALVVDVATNAGRDAIVDAASARGVNMLINNAGLAAFGPTANIDPAHAQAVLDTNLLAPMLLTASLLPHLLDQPRAQILNIGSTLGSIGVPGFALYGASKAGLRSFSESLRRELAGTRVSVQYLAPRAIDTPFNSPAVRAFNAATRTPADTPQAVARRVISVLRDEKVEHFIGGVEPVAARLNGAFSRWLDGGFARHRHALAVPSRFDQPVTHGDES